MQIAIQQSLVEKHNQNQIPLQEDGEDDLDIQKAIAESYNI